MHDTLGYMKHDPVHRRFHHHRITFALLYAFSENFVLPLSHDEVVHMKGSLIGKLPGDYWQKFAQLRLLFGYQYTQVGKILNFMGNEIGQFAEWSEERSLDWRLLEYEKHAQLQAWVRDRTISTEISRRYGRSTLTGGLFLDRSQRCRSTASTAISRFAADKRDFLVVILNCTPVIREGYRVGVPGAGYYEELLNSDAEVYGGGNIGNLGGVDSEAVASHGFPHSIRLRLPTAGDYHPQAQIRLGDGETLLVRAEL